ncbi:MAG TPA: hypothetical protein VFK34_08290 [Marmoricola sp.]|nr:hypothetical protein [Marmoricola sp.]
MGASTSRPQILVIGLDPYRVPGPWDPRPVADATAAGMNELGKRGLAGETCLVGPDGGDDIAEAVSRRLGSS